MYYLEIQGLFKTSSQIQGLFNIVRIPDVSGEATQEKNMKQKRKPLERFLKGQMKPNTFSCLKKSYTCCRSDSVSNIHNLAGISIFGSEDSTCSQSAKNTWSSCTSLLTSAVLRPGDRIEVKRKQPVECVVWKAALTSH